MDEIKENVGHLRKTQGPVALSGLQAALTDHVGDMNRRLQAGLAVRQTQMAFEVLGPGKTNALLRVSLTKENNIHYAQFVKRQNQTQSGVIYVRTSQDGTPAILFSDFPRSQRGSELSRSLQTLAGLLFLKLTGGLLFRWRNT